MNIFLIGLMGSGKTFWANKISAVLNIPAFDSGQRD
jgi:shikimate kinase